MIVKQVILRGDSITLSQYDGDHCTLYEVKHNEFSKGLVVSNLAVALNMFDRLCEETYGKNN